MVGTSFPLGTYSTCDFPGEGGGFRFEDGPEPTPPSGSTHASAYQNNIWISKYDKTIKSIMSVG